MDLAVLERHQSRLKWQLLQQQFYANQTGSIELCSVPQFQGRVEAADWQKKFGNLPIAGAELVANKMGFVQSELATNSLGMDHGFSRTSSCQMELADAEMMKEKDEDVAMIETTELNTTGRDSLNKRKAEIVVTEECKDKRVKAEVEVESEVKDKRSRETSADTSKALGVQKTDYIHVRARRGQATDSHSLAERARRDKISKKMKCLQDLVPGCNKVTGKAGMLDEIINYVQSLQRQVEFLSMKLAALNPMLEFNTDHFSAKELPACAANFPAATKLPAVPSLASLQFNPQQQGTNGCMLDMQVHSTQTATQRNIIDTSGSFLQVQPFSTWDADLQRLENVGFHN